MQELRVTIHVASPVERVFDAMSDHETFLTGDDGTIAKVVRAGAADRNGLGCLREVKKGRALRFVEEITAFQRPSSYEYLIKECSLPMRHFGGRLSFSPSTNGTDVEWTTRFEIPVPIAAMAFEPIAARLLKNAFNGILNASKRRLEAR